MSHANEEKSKAKMAVAQSKDARSPDDALVPDDSRSPDDATASGAKEIALLPLYPTEQYRALGIPHCGECGEKFRTGMYGEAICAIDKVDCTGITHHA